MLEPSGPVTASLTWCVPMPLPSETQSSSPCVPSLPMKNSLFPAQTSSAGSMLSLIAVVVNVLDFQSEYPLVAVKAENQTKPPCETRSRGCELFTESDGATRTRLPCLSAGRGGTADRG